MTTETPTDSLTASIRLTDVAATKVAALLAQEGRDDLMLRVAVQGCVTSSTLMIAIKMAMWFMSLEALR